MTAVKQMWHSLLGCAPKMAAARLLLPFVAGMILSGIFLPTQAHQAQQKSSSARRNTPSRDLHKIGEAIAKAVLDKNIETLLTFDRADLLCFYEQRRIFAA